MKKILFSVIQGLVAAKNGETVADNYVKLQEGWSVNNPQNQADGSVKMDLSYSVLFFDLAEQKYYSTTQRGTVQSMGEAGGDSRLVVRQPFKGFRPDDIDHVVDSWPVIVPYPTIMTERPIG
ncbi:Uncharacterised protein [Serratia rubidaea]|uniref:Uncharacterized protein n=1 Tax=Serratia rubidaea TaxID=61652 RepID=A0A3S4HB37_SERRU|nr:hypothetical protein [Serratia rubidaea]UJD80631.1 hypothetical protein FS596_13340 [Serratia rubidaea]UJD85187.1 hypothetical protein FS595_13340 [Serratia rubidaea]VEA74070.1 Uncharacterised protein [Serratia rubidaea]